MPVEVVPETPRLEAPVPTLETTAKAPGMIEITLPSGATVRVGGQVDVAVLRGALAELGGR